MKTISLIIIFMTSIAIYADDVLYKRLGEMQSIEAVVDQLVVEISYDKELFPYFKQTNAKRFKTKLAEQICMISDGPCQYSGDSMEQSHAGMNISKRHFNRLVEALQRSMNKAEIPYTAQNELIKRLASMRSEIIQR